MFVVLFSDRVEYRSEYLAAAGEYARRFGGEICEVLAEVLEKDAAEKPSEKTKATKKRRKT